jgi:hypothetical protein
VVGTGAALDAEEVADDDEQAATDAAIANAAAHRVTLTTSV